MRALLIANGWMSQPVIPQPGDVLIAADGGARRCLEFGLRPDYVVGDLDSLEESHLNDLQMQGVQIIRYPTRKDYTDLELAIQHAMQLGADEIVILAALGARWDQTIANLLLPAAFANLHIRLIDGSQEITLLHAGNTLHIQGKPGDTVSLIALTAKAQGIQTQNLEYPLYDETLYLGNTRGVSNVLLSESAAITLKEGLLLCITIHQPNNLE